MSRMKAYSSSIRFIAVSATIPNACDFALWIGRRENEPRIIGRAEEEDDDAAQLYTFSEAFRPCPLKKVVYGYRNPGNDPWAFDKELNRKLLDVIKNHANNKAAIVFCSTRKMASSSAQMLAKAYHQLVEAQSALPWSLSEVRPPQLEAEDALLQGECDAVSGSHSIRTSTVSAHGQSYTSKVLAFITQASR